MPCFCTTCTATVHFQWFTTGRTFFTACMPVQQSTCLVACPPPCLPIYYSLENLYILILHLLSFLHLLLLLNPARLPPFPAYLKGEVPPWATSGWKNSGGTGKETSDVQRGITWQSVTDWPRHWYCVEKWRTLNCWLRMNGWEMVMNNKRDKKMRQVQGRSKWWWGQRWVWKEWRKETRQDTDRKEN